MAAAGFITRTAVQDALLVQVIYRRPCNAPIVPYGKTYLLRAQFKSTLKATQNKQVDLYNLLKKVCHIVMLKTNLGCN